MSPGDVLSVSPPAIRFKLSGDLDLGGIVGGAWDVIRRVPIEQTDKHRSIFQRYVEGLPWAETDVFRGRYTEALKRGDRARGVRTLDEAARLYEREIDPIFADLKKNGFRTDVILPKVHIGRDGEVLLGNNGNHRVAMAKVLGLPRIPVRIHTMHADYGKGPELPACAADIPAMTKLDERLAYYRLALGAVDHGEIVELGAWLGAATAYLAAAVRDSGWLRRVRVYDRFVWDPSHAAKGAKSTDMLGQFKTNLGPLLDYVDVHQGEIADLKWTTDCPVSLIVFDAPKRIPTISAALTKFAPAVREGTLLAWQDFAYFPSYDIPAALMRLGTKIEFIEGVYPGTTAIFRVNEPWTPDEVTEDDLDLKDWTADAIEKEWDIWAARLPEPMRPRFQCGAACFLVDNGFVGRGKDRLRTIVEAHAEEVGPKWRVLFDTRRDFVARWRPLFEMLDKMGLLFA